MLRGRGDGEELRDVNHEDNLRGMRGQRQPALVRCCGHQRCQGVWMDGWRGEGGWDVPIPTDGCPWDLGDMERCISLILSTRKMC